MGGAPLPRVVLNTDRDEEEKKEEEKETKKRRQAQKIDMKEVNNKKRKKETSVRENERDSGLHRQNIKYKVVKDRDRNGRESY